MGEFGLSIRICPREGELGATAINFAIEPGVRIGGCKSALLQIRAGLEARGTIFPSGFDSGGGHHRRVAVRFQPSVHLRYDAVNDRK
ncbi:hypothetical protein [Bradyrhizobium sp. Ash2021]|uniref:hypothetical protein n=1 Tax=Bradyrhizobium sp. Ash2021 TaxID=2954771 RepID=UPI0028167967|nr:hypothetical protein [Bradyrhizobium sp. Ash2021]WMT79366.1 hypothetical protein NL528_43215 [Bradyrhizobium sp. Ash2021]